MPGGATAGHAPARLNPSRVASCFNAWVRRSADNGRVFRWRFEAFRIVPWILIAKWREEQQSMRRIRGFVLAAFAAAVLMPGCGPGLTEKDLGTIDYQVPKVPGAEEPYPLPSPGPKTKDESISAGDEDLPLPSSEGAVPTSGETAN
jgi:hypothetical protein